MFHVLVGGVLILAGVGWAGVMLFGWLWEMDAAQAAEAQRLALWGVVAAAAGILAIFWW